MSEPVQLAYGDSRIEERLRIQLQNDLNFNGHQTSYSSHNTHAFAAKFPPQLPRAFIEELTDVGEVVLDPMAGSGTAIVEAALTGRVGIGADLDPLAASICSAKTTPLDPEWVMCAGENIADHARLLLTREGPGYSERVLATFDEKTKGFIEYWFEANTVAELGALRHAIARLAPPETRSLFEVIFSSGIVTKSGGVSRARDLAHSRPHRVNGKRIRNGVEVFEERVRKVAKSLDDIRAWPGRAHVIRSDSRMLPIADHSVDLVVTSPPYANAIDYMRAHKFSLVWMGYPIDTLTQLRRTYIGAELRPDDECPIPSETGCRVVEELRVRDAKRGGVIAKYFREMTLALAEMHRVLREGRSAIVVVGSSTVRGTQVPTALVLAEIGERIGFRLIGVKDRTIDRNRRLMPTSHVSDKTGIEARMHGEQVIAFIKPA